MNNRISVTWYPFHIYLEVPTDNTKSITYQHGPTNALELGDAVS